MLDATPITMAGTEPAGDTLLKAKSKSMASASRTNFNPKSNSSKEALALKLVQVSFLKKLVMD